MNVNWRLVAVGGAPAALFVAWAIAMRMGLTYGLDHQLLALLRRADKTHSFVGSRAELKMLVGVTTLGGGTVRALVTITAALVLGLRHRGREAAMLAFAVAGGALAMPLLKILFDRPRPDFLWHLVMETTRSFPSGHAMGAMILYPLLGYIAGTTRGRGRAALLAGLGVVIGLLVGATRVLLGVHWASDVIGGWLIGGAVAVVAVGVFRKPLKSFG